MQTATKYGITPGTWHFDKEEEPKFSKETGLPYLSVYGGSFEIIRVHGNGKTHSSADAQAISALPELIQQLQTTNVNLGLIHSEYQINQGGHGSLDTCDCPLATNWRNNRAALAKAGVQ
jgi:hypothetical protein